MHDVSELRSAHRPGRKQSQSSSIAPVRAFCTSGAPLFSILCEVLSIAWLLLQVQSDLEEEIR